MGNSKQKVRPGGLLNDYGILLVLLALMAVLSLATISKQQSSGAAAGRALAAQILDVEDPRNILVVTPEGKLDIEMGAAFVAALAGSDHRVLGVVHGGPVEARSALSDIGDAGTRLDVIVTTDTSSRWDPVGKTASNLPEFESLASRQLLMPSSYTWPDFLMPDNLVTIAQRIAILAILAIGMTMVILTAGIDLSVGSLIALSAVITGVLIRDVAGGKEADAIGMTLAAMGGIAACGVAGFSTGFLVAAFRLPPFIVTLAMMLIIRGVANVVSDQRTIHEVPASFETIGKGYLLGVPYSVILMFALYGLAHFVMTRTTLGRQIYAVGGNEEAARLSGVMVKRVQLIVYTVCGLLAGLGGVLLASQLRSAKASYGLMDELTVIAAVVVGGTSLMGGEGRILGTLIGALIIGVIQNGMNLVHMDDKTQMIVLGTVILIAVLLDRIKKGRVNWADVRGIFRR